ncbi:MAG: hypothetical protein OEY27_07235 [Gammaproteobacteria bacterium]|nr:hypothetical protein [Gammaproteobacteria bacterium]
MGIDSLLLVFLVWLAAGLLAAMAFGRAIQESSPEDEEGLAEASGTLKYIRKNRATPRIAAHEPELQLTRTNKAAN